MISRVAENCYWLYRYIERMDNTARMVDVNSTLILDTQLDVSEAWVPLLIVAGEAPRYAERHGSGTPDGEAVQRYLTWDDECPVSIFSSARAAREGGRSIRESISREMWECLNKIWLWLDQGAGRRSYKRDRADFFDRIKEAAQLFRGVTADTMLHEEPFEFMQLGMQIERAGMTARIIDVKYEMLALRDAEQDAPRELAQCHAILRSCSAVEPFLKRVRSFNVESIAFFLAGDKTFPRAIRHCIDQACVTLDRIRSVSQEEGRDPDEAVPGESCSAALRSLASFVAAIPEKQSDADGLHEAMTFTINALAQIGSDLHESFFAPSIPAKPRA